MVLREAVLSVYRAPSSGIFCLPPQPHTTFPSARFINLSVCSCFWALRMYYVRVERRETGMYALEWVVVTRLDRSCSRRSRRTLIRFHTWLADFNYDIASRRRARPCYWKPYWNFSPRKSSRTRCIIGRRQPPRNFPRRSSITFPRRVIRRFITRYITRLERRLDRLIQHCKTSTASPPRMIPHLHHQITACESVMCDFSEKR